MSHGPSRRRFAAIAITCLLALLGALPAAADPVPGSSSTPASIATGGTVDVTLTLDGETTVESTPTDVVFVLDESGSINSSEFDQVQSFVVNMINALADDGIFANGGTIGVVGFAESARTIQPPTTHQGTVVSAVNGINQMPGYTCNGCGLQEANSLLNGIAGAAGHNQIVIQLTDGGSNQTPEVQTVLTSTNASDKLRFAIGVGNGIDQAELNLIASEPDAQHVFNVTDFNALAAVTESIVAAVVLPGATDASVVVSPAGTFAYVSGSALASTGSFNEGTLSWDIGDLGDETVTLSYTLASDGVTCGPALPLHDAIVYSDNEGASVAFDLLAAEVTGCLVAEAGPGQTIEQTSPAGADATLDGSGSTDAVTIGAGPLTYSWDFGGLTGVAPTGSFPAGTTTVELTVSNGFETATDTVEITVQDTIAPVLTFTGDTTYGLVDTVDITCSATDSGSGVADDCDDANTSGPAWTFGAGTTTINGEATDVAGNVGTADFTFEVVVDVEGLCELTKEFNDKDNGQEDPAMCGKLDKGKYRQYRSHVSAQSGKAFTVAEADLLIELSHLLG